MESIEVTHLETLPGAEGEYTIDVTVRFRAFQGAQFLVLVECKKHKNPIKREVIQVLHDRLRSVGGHKGFVVATTSFQAGAVEYATQHGIALVQVVSGGVMYIRATADTERLPFPSNVPRFVGCHFSPTSEAALYLSLSAETTQALSNRCLTCADKHSRGTTIWLAVAALRRVVATARPPGGR